MQLFDVLLSLGVKPVAVFDGQNLEGKKITREKRERLHVGVKSTSSHCGLIQRDYTVFISTNSNFCFPFEGLATKMRQRQKNCGEAGMNRKLSITSGELSKLFVKCPINY